jgi:Protein of unknown function, DUF547
MIGRPQVLNPGSAEAELEPVELSRRLLGDARRAEDATGCAGLERLARQLHGVDPTAIEGDQARIAFWVNLYNALVLHCLCRRPLKGNLLFHLRMFDRVAYQVGPHTYPLNLIENGVLRGNRRAPFRPRRPLGRNDPRAAAAPERVDERIHFALNCGAVSCPPIQAYGARSLDAQLEAATTVYLRSETTIDGDRCSVRLPSLMRLYRADFGAREDQIAFAAERVPEIKPCLRNGRKPRLRYARFDWTVASRPESG